MDQITPQRQPVICVVAVLKSGTTWFGTMLSRMQDTVNLGEVWASLYTNPEEFSHPRNRCTCGALMSECDFWGPVVDQTHSSDTNAQRHARVLEHFREKFPGKVLLDSSKSVDILGDSWLAPELADKVDVKFIFLVRDYRAWAISRKKSHNRKGRPRPLYVQILRWWLRNIKRDRYLQRCGRPVLTLTYESVVFDTEKTMQKVMAFTGLQQVEAQQTVEDLSLHISRGNHVRDDLNNFSQIRYDHSWTLDKRLLWLSILLLPMQKFWKSVNQRASSD